MLLPYFTSHYTIGSSILTCEPDKNITENSPVSIFAIAKAHGLESVAIVDEDIAGFWKMYKSGKDLGVNVAFGLKLTLCQAHLDHTDDSEKTESKVIIWLKNSQAYYDMVPLYSEASTHGYYGGNRRLSAKELSKYWTPNFAMTVPFYSSFIARNLLRWEHRALPDLKQFNPSFFCESHDLPFDYLIQDGLKKYCEAENHPILNAHQIYYYKTKDVKKYLTYKCMTIPPEKGKRRTLDCPNFDQFSSDQFSFESWQERNK